jgi:2-methylcitrate dehydratase PrpD
MIGQDSIPFCVALALLDDPADPRSFREADVADPRIRTLSGRIQLMPWAGSAPPSRIATLTPVKTNDGRVLKGMVSDFKGTPDNPLNREELREKFLMLTRDRDPAAMCGFFERLQRIEDEPTLGWVSV